MHELLATGDFVRALARQLLGEADGDDVAQDAWLLALERRPAALREPRAWLARIVRRLAANRRRGEQRRGAREQAVAATRSRHAPSTDEILACEQARQRVVAAVLALEEPFRATVLARFYECLDTAMIAARDRVPEATVRSRLKRGLDRLRAQLDGQHGGRAAWAAPLALLGREPVPLALPLGAAMTSSKKAAAVLAALAFVSLVLWTSGVFAPAGPSPLLAPAATAPAFAGSAAVPPRDDAARTAADLAAQQARAGQPRDDFPFPVTDEPFEEVPVRVLDAGTREPVAGAEVVFLPFRVDYMAPRARGDQRLQELAGTGALLERFGSRVRTGSSGTAVIRVPWSGAWVVAMHGDRRVTANVVPSRLLLGECVALHLEPGRLLRVRIVDETTRAPVEGVLLEVSHTTHRPVVGHGEGVGGMAGPSDQQGLVAIPLTSTQRAVRVEPWITGARSAVALDLPAALERVTEVRCRATGSMTIELRTPGGALWPTPILAAIRAEGCSPSPTSGPVTWRSSEPGVYRMPHVEVGRSWTIEAVSERGGGERVTTVAAGPRAPGEHVVVVLRTASEPCVAWADLRTASGSPPAANFMAIVLQGEPSGDDRHQRAWAAPDATGRLGWTLAPGIEPTGRIELQNDWSRATPLTAAWRLDAATPGAHELGVLVVGEAPVVVAGSVEVGGEPWHGPPLRVQVEVASPGGEWRPAGWPMSALVRPAVDRAFTIHGRLEAQRVRVRVLPDAHCLPGEPQLVECGARGVQLPVTYGARLRARVLAPAGYAQALTLRATRADGGPLPGVAAEATWEPETSRGEARLVDRDGTAATFAWPALPAGSYRVDVLAPGVREPLASLDGVRAGEGAPPDARLDPIDLRARARTLAVSVVPLPAGLRPITDGGVAAFPSGAPGGTVHGMLFDARGEARLLVGPDPVDVLVAVPGFRLWRANGVTAGTLQVQLEPPLAVPFRLVPRVAERLAGHRVHVELDPIPPREDQPAICFTRPGEREPSVQTMLHCLQRLADGGRGTLADSRAAGTIPIAAPGRFAVRLAIETPREWIHVNESWKNWQSSPLVPSDITVLGTGDAGFVVDVEEDVLARLADRLSRAR